MREPPSGSVVHPHTRRRTAVAGAAATSDDRGVLQDASPQPPATVARDECAAIETRGLTKRYGAARGIDDVTFSITTGEVFCFLGPNGAG